MAKSPEQENTSSDRPTYQPRPPKARQLFPDVLQETLPEILRVDQRTGDAIRKIVTDAIDGTDALRMNSAQIDFVIAYVRYRVVNGMDVKQDALTAAALHFLEQQPELDPPLLKALHGSKTVTGAAEKLKGKEAAEKIVDEPTEGEAAVEATKQQTVSNLKLAQEAFKIGNYDEAVILADRAARITHPTADAILCAGMCYFMRAAKKPFNKTYTADNKIEDLGEAMTYLQNFIVLTIKNPRYEQQCQAAQAKIQQASIAQLALIKKQPKKK